MNKKRLLRHNFRAAVFSRDNFICQKCGVKHSDLDNLNAHHIKDRTLIVNGGYVPENGITLCLDCHLKAEMFHSTGKSFEGYSEEDLYYIIGSSLKMAIKESEKL